ncbi:hypothetical protein MNBD_GAMMA12-1143 [hydrothermal vent metagenome]|uniref:HEAT repeat domain-containing protein n=1 Tax=hydrothermal vent metagenome TaxID=652676 RepID=A0A3B0YHU4_9ZZZZ
MNTCTIARLFKSFAVLLVLTFVSVTVVAENSIQYQVDQSKFDAEVKELLVDLKHKDAAKRRNAAYAFSVKRNVLKKQEKTQAVLVLINTLKDTDPSVRKVVAKTLGALGRKNAVPPLIKALQDKSWDVRRYAAMGLTSLGDTRASKHITKLIKNDLNSTVKWFSAIYFRNVKDKKEVPSLMALLNNTKLSINVRESAAHALGGIGDSRATSVLIKALKEKNHTLRARAAIALGEIGDGKAIPAIASVLRDKNREVRLFATIGLTEYKNPKVIPHLVKMLKDKDASIRKEAVKGLKKYPNKKVAKQALLKSSSKK